MSPNSLLPQRTTPESASVTSGTALGRRSFLRAVGLGAVVLGAGGFAAACSSSDDDDSGDGATSAAAGGSAAISGEVRNIQLSWIKNIEFAGEFFADDKGYYKDAGLTIELLAGGAASTSAEVALDNKKAWVGITSPQLTAPAILEGAELKTIGATFQKNPFCIVSKEGSGIDSPEAMKGKRIGVQDSNTLVFDALLAANNIDASDVTVVPAQYDPTPLTTGEVDGWVSYVTNEPITLAATGFANTNFLFADFGLPLVAEAFVVNQSTIDDERDALKAFLIAEIKGWRDAVQDSAGSANYAVTKYGKDLGLEQADQAAQALAQADLVVTEDTQANGLFTMTEELIQSNIDALATAGIEITAEELFDLSILEEIYEEMPELKAPLTIK